MNIKLARVVAFKASDFGDHIPDCRAMTKPAYQILNWKFSAVSAVAALDRKAVAGNHCQQCAVFHLMSSPPLLEKKNAS